MKEQPEIQPALFDSVETYPVFRGRGPLSPKQQRIMEIITNEGSITLERAVKEIGGNIYHNRARYVGLTLSRMVARGVIQRVKRGVFSMRRATQ